MTSAVALTTYNGEQYIIEQLNSIIMQDEKVEEVIICDDGSQDRTVEIIRNFILEKHLESTWKLIINEKNMGYGNNFHKAMNLCQADLVFLCDQDDIWRENKVSVMKKVMQQNQKIMLLCSDYMPFSSSDDAPSIHRKVLKSMNDDGQLVKVEITQNDIFLGRLGCLMCVRKEFLNKAEAYWYDGWAHDDYLWKTALCFSGCYILHKKLIDRRLHSNNVSMKPKHSVNQRIAYLEELLKTDRAMLRCAKDNNLETDKLNVIVENIVATELRLHMFKQNRMTDAVKLLKYWKCYQSKRAIFTEPLIMIRNK